MALLTIEHRRRDPRRRCPRPPHRARFPLGPLLPLVLVIVSLAPATPALGQPIPRDDVAFFPSSLRVGVYRMFQAYLTVGDPPEGNPFQDRLVTARFTHRSTGTVVEVDGYCDSQDGSLFGLRFAPRHEGEYDFLVRYEDAVGTAEFEGTLEALPSSVPGFLRVSERHPYHFVWEKTGRYFFHHGHTAYHLANQVVPEENWKGYIDHIVERGFNKVRFLILSGRNQFYWHFLIFPFTGDPDTSTYDRYELSLWAHYDDVISYMADRGVVASVIFEVEKESLVERFGGWDVPTEKEYQYYRYAVARLGAYWNVIWDLGNEHTEYHTQNWARTMGRFVRDVDPYDHLLSVHGYQQFLYPEEEWADYLILQAYPGGGAVVPNDDWFDLHSKVNWQRIYRKPVVDDEYGYEEPWPPDLVRKTHWGVVMAGGYPSYGSFESMSVRVEEQRLFSDEVVPDQLVHLRRLFDGIDFWLFEPRVDLIVERGGSWAWCLARMPGEYLVYLPDGGDVTVDLSAAEGLDLPVEWMDPATGTWVEGTPPTTGGEPTYHGVPPFQDDALLFIGRTRRDEPYVDTFEETPLPDWHVESGRWKVWQGAYIQRHADRVAATTLATHTFASFRLSFDLRLQGEGFEGWAGIQFRKETAGDGLTRSGYLLDFYPNGKAFLMQASGEDLEPLTPGGHATEGWRAGDWNHVEVIVKEAGITVAVNGRTQFREMATRRYPRGFLSLVSLIEASAFDNLRIEPIFYESFEDDVADGLFPARGTWQTYDGAFLQKDRSVIAACNVGGRRFGDLSFRFRLEIPEQSGDVLAGVNVGGSDPLDSGFAGYFVFLRPGDQTLGIARASGGSPPVPEFLVVRPLAGTGITPHGENELIVEVKGNHIEVSTRERILLDYQDPNPDPITGHVNLVTVQGAARFDNLYLHQPRDD